MPNPIFQVLGGGNSQSNMMQQFQQFMNQMKGMFEGMRGMFGK